MWEFSYTTRTSVPGSSNQGSRAMHRNKVGILTFAAVVALGACGDTTEPEMEPLTEAEANQIASFLIGQSIGSTGMPASFQEMARMEPGTLPVARARVDFNESRTQMTDCALGGTLEVTSTVQGFLDDESGEFEIDAMQTQVYEGCTGQADSEDFTFTLDSAPSVVSDFFIAMDAQGALDAFGFLEGSIDWESGDRSGRCDIDFQFDLSTEGQTLTLSASGVVCGITLEQNVTITQ